jgi:hypothetical protein
MICYICNGRSLCGKVNICSARKSEGLKIFIELLCSELLTDGYKEWVTGIFESGCKILRTMTLMLVAMNEVSLFGFQGAGVRKHIS